MPSPIKRHCAHHSTTNSISNEQLYQWVTQELENRFTANISSVAQHICHNLRAHYVDWSMFPKLQNEDWQVLIPYIGPRIFLKELILDVQSPSRKKCSSCQARMPSRSPPYDGKLTSDFSPVYADAISAEKRLRFKVPQNAEFASKRERKRMGSVEAFDAEGTPTHNHGDGVPARQDSEVLTTRNSQASVGYGPIIVPVLKLKKTRLGMMSSRLKSLDDFEQLDSGRRISFAPEKASPSGFPRQGSEESVIDGRPSSNGRRVQVPKPEEEVNSPGTFWDCSICASCNFSDRPECMKCGTPAPEGTLPATASSEGSEDAGDQSPSAESLVALSSPAEVSGPRRGSPIIRISPAHPQPQGWRESSTDSLHLASPPKRFSSQWKPAFQASSDSITSEPSKETPANHDHSRPAGAVSPLNTPRDRSVLPQAAGFGR
eukprot:EG_transcript_6166